jgi:hypothetical protein
MKALKILCVVLALLMVGMVFVACGDSKDQDTTTDEGDVLPREPLNVNIVVKDSVDGEVKYASDENRGYDFIGSTTTPLAILEEFMDFEYNVQLTYDDNGKLATVGDLAATTGHLWIWSLAKAPKDASMAEPMDANLDDYTDITKGDTIVIYLS